MTERFFVVFGANSDVEDAVRQLAGSAPVLVYDDVPQTVDLTGHICGPWWNGFDYIKNHPKDFFWVVNAVASTPAKRAEAFVRITNALSECMNWTDYTVIAPSAIVSKYATIGRRVLVLAGAYVGSKCVLEEDVAILPCARAHHYTTIGEGSIIVSGAEVLGRVKIGKYCWICGNATILPGSELPDNVTIAAGRACRIPGDPIRQVAWRAEQTQEDK